MFGELFVAGGLGDGFCLFWICSGFFFFCGGCCYVKEQKCLRIQETANSAVIHTYNML